MNEIMRKDMPYPPWVERNATLKAVWDDFK